MNKQSTSHLFMIEPESFYSNEQTSYTNHYQKKVTDETPEDVAGKALGEFHALKVAIESRGIKITSLKGSKDCPDHIFPNWFITFDDKTMQIFSMMAPNRRTEKKPQMIEHLKETYKLTEDMSNLESQNIFLESTSSMVFDRVNRCVYAGISARTNKDDVLMYVGTDMIGICLDVIKPEYREYVERNAKRFHEVMILTSDQILNFCGNAIEAKNESNELFLIISERAYKALDQEQIDMLLLHYKEIIYSDIPTIEKYGGGSARCMLTELF